MQVLVCGAELYTSNTALMPVAYYEKKATLQQVCIVSAACCFSAFAVAEHEHEAMTREHTAEFCR